MNKTIFITGASSGIGKATVELFLEKGWNVIATVRDIQKSQFISQKNLCLVQVDVTNIDSIKNGLRKGFDEFKKIDVVVNNAGYGLLGPLETSTPDQIFAQYNVNVIGTINVIREIIPYFNIYNQGTIINISSMLGKISLPYFSVYSSTKFAIEGLSESLRFELSNFGIKVKLIQPGTIKTDFFTRSLITTKYKDVENYNADFTSILNDIKKRGEKGALPLEVASTIYKATKDNSNRFHYPVDKSAKMLLTLHKYLPLNLYQKIIRTTIK